MSPYLLFERSEETGPGKVGPRAVSVIELTGLPHESFSDSEFIHQVSDQERQTLDLLPGRPAIPVREVACNADADRHAVQTLA